MANLSCPSPFLDASFFPSNEGYVHGRFCSPITLPLAKPDTICCLPCPLQNYILHPSSIRALHANDIVNIVGLGVGGFILLVLSLHYLLIQSFIFLPKNITYRSSLGIAISLAAFLVNVHPPWKKFNK